MTKSQKLALERSEKIQRINALLEKEDRSEAETTELDALTKRSHAIETEYRAAVTVEDAEAEAARAEHGGGDTKDGEGAEFRALEGRVSLRAYLDNTMGEFRSSSERGLNLTGGAELEFNQALKIPSDRVPLQLFAGAESEERAKTDTDTTVVPRRWVDRLFAGTAAEHLGIRMESVGSGKATFPLTTAGGVPAQRGREEAADVAAWTVSAVDLDPTRMSAHYVFANEDAYRVGGLEDSLVRDMKTALKERMDRVIFLGDSGANENRADIAGLLGMAGVTEATLTQANRLKGDKILETFAGMIDGEHAEDLADLKIVTSVGTTRLWLSTVQNAAAENQTVGQFLRESGVMWKTRGGIDTNTAAGDYGAAIGLARGQMGTGVCPVWNSAELIRDKWTGAKSGQVQITLHAFWNFGLVRKSNFQTLKYVA